MRVAGCGAFFSLGSRVISSSLGSSVGAIISGVSFLHLCSRLHSLSQHPLRPFAIFHEGRSYIPVFRMEKMKEIKRPPL
ncbi:hypothetical protein B296_00044749 [Ensete ventricosum]|uniref:Uncharacterized protein n=1 Tax=Ensete ventricosum TaxID=4639 RepID=A0A426X1V2_ENSVE|nr:hypothetical protein B296_00044749 [Ensete ventricosum]